MRFERRKIERRRKISTERKTHESFFQATPLLIHLLMICSVGVYAIFGAVVMRQLESRSVAEITVEVERRHIEQKDEASLARALEVGLKHKRRRRHNETDHLEILLKKLQAV
ncbi:hypothetical protein NECAME_09818 [Necator americanus]|uniref:Uncharacterized protein n=1 Tax=Necator americanus TaxID=51031 RepID=W2TBK2_NECAM|nr:hypothetical protein NECAME_09818 [Necator americanus]ETN79415.1 hypothetical protein NECAME_09818 [Necator americanus]